MSGDGFPRRRSCVETLRTPSLPLVAPSLGFPCYRALEVWSKGDVEVYCKSLRRLVARHRRAGGAGAIGGLFRGLEAWLFSVRLTVARLPRVPFSVFRGRGRFGASRLHAPFSGAATPPLASTSLICNKSAQSAVPCQSSCTFVVLCGPSCQPRRVNPPQFPQYSIRRPPAARSVLRSRGRFGASRLHAPFSVLWGAPAPPNGSLMILFLTFWGK